jgi:hypothetical protein
MCDYSLHLVASRPAKVGDKLVATRGLRTDTALRARACTRAQGSVGSERSRPLIRPVAPVAPVPAQRCENPRRKKPGATPTRLFGRPFLLNAHVVA